MSATISGCLIFKAEYSYFFCWFELEMKLELELELFLNVYSWKIQLLYKLVANSYLKKIYASSTANKYHGVRPFGKYKIYF